MEFERLIYLYGTSCRNMRDNKNKHSVGVSCTACTAFMVIIIIIIIIVMGLQSYFTHFEQS